MFGLFRKETPENKLADKVTKMIKTEVDFAFKQSTNDTILGYLVDLAIATVYKNCNDNVHLLAVSYNISISKTFEIIKDCTNKARQKYLKNADLL